MLKNDKIFVFLVVLFSFLFLVGTTAFASTETYSFTGFDGVSYELPALPDGVNNYNHYVIVHGTSSPYYSILCFNETLEVSRDENFIYLSGDNGTTLKLFALYTDSWEEFSESGKYSFLLGSVFIYSCPDLTQYGEELNGEEDFFLNPQTILPPIAEKIHLGVVLQEIIQILPVVLVVIVALIAMRKAIVFLTQILRQS